MKVGDLVKQKDIFADWQEDNTWMEDKELTGVVVETANPSDYNYRGMVRVYWFADCTRVWRRVHRLEVINESR